MRTGKSRRFGFITTNSLPQTFSRRVVERHLADKKALSLVFAVPDHPWVDAADGAAVRIAMTVGAAGNRLGRIATVEHQVPANDRQGRDVELTTNLGKIHSNLRIGADLTTVNSLEANGLLSSPGVKLHGSGFIVTRQEAKSFGLGKIEEVEQRIRPYLNGRDLMDKPRGVMVIDLFGLTDVEARQSCPGIYQHVFDHVKPERDHNGRRSYRKYWWIHGEPRKELRKALSGLPRYIATVETAKYRVFQFLDISILPDNKLLNIAISDASALGVLSNRIHVTWALAAGGRLGVGNDPVYVKTKCFDPFPFPISSENQSLAIGDLAEELDPHRKRIQADHPDITLTGMYNVLKKLKSGNALTDSDKDVHGRGLVSVLKDLHKPLDAAVFTAYGWDAGLNDEGILEKLVALNHERAREEVKGQVRWLRLEYQAPDEAARATRRAGNHGRVRGRGRARQETPLAQKTLPAQFEAVRDVLDAAETPLRAEDVARNFSRANKNKVTEVLHTLNALSQVHMVGDARFAA